MGGPIELWPLSVTIPFLAVDRFATMLVKAENLGNYILFDTKTRKRRHTDRAFSGDSLPYLRSNREIIRKFLR